MHKIFDRLTELKPAAMATVAERRLADAKALLDTDKNQHANAAVYLAGFTIEILLKARLVDKYPTVAHLPPGEINRPGVSKTDRRIWNLIWQSHNLSAILGQLKEFSTALDARSRRHHEPHWRNLMAICSGWSIYARYSTHTIDRESARDFIERVDSLKELLKGYRP